MVPAAATPLNEAPSAAYKEVADLGVDVQMFTEMMVRLGNLQHMQ
jgi:hypothetical protein